MPPSSAVGPPNLSLPLKDSRAPADLRGYGPDIPSPVDAGAGGPDGAFRMPRPRKRGARVGRSDNARRGAAALRPGEGAGAPPGRPRREADGAVQRGRRSAEAAEGADRGRPAPAARGPDQAQGARAG